MGTGIASVEVIPYSLPFRVPYRSARGELDKRELVLLRLRARDGTVGLGEAVPLTLRGSGTLEGVVEELRAWGEEPLRDSRLSPAARCAVDTASLDLTTRSDGIPFCQMFDVSEAVPIECNATLGADGPSQAAEAASAWASEGFHTFKLKVGVDGDLETAVAVRDAVGDEANLRVDANGAWSAARAKSALDAMHERVGLELAEQPCPSLDELASLRRAVDVPIAADESVVGVLDAREARSGGACDLATVKLSKVGGPWKALAVAREIPVYLSSALDGPVGIAAAAHMAQALRGRGDAGVAHGLATQRLFAETIASRECELRDGFLHLPEGPGLGVEIDDAALERHRL